MIAGSSKNYYNSWPTDSSGAEEKQQSHEKSVILYKKRSEKLVID